MNTSENYYHYISLFERMIQDVWDTPRLSQWLSWCKWLLPDLEKLPDE